MRPSTFLPSPGPRRRLAATSLMVPLLAATIVLAVYLGFEAVYAARSHREAAESALRDYGRVAAWQYSAGARDQLDDVFHDLLSDIPWRRRGDRPSDQWILEELSTELTGLRCECPALHRPAVMFQADPDTRTAQLYRGAVPLRGMAWLADTLAHRYAELVRHRYALVSLPPGTVFDSGATVAYMVTHGPDDRTTLFGFATPTAAWSELFQRWFETEVLLPPAITGNTPNDSLLHVAVRGPDGDAAFESAMTFPTTLAASDTLVHEFGPFTVEASVRQDAAARLIIGGLPKSKLPLIIGLLLLTLGVGGAALYQIRRERQLAQLRDDFISGVSHELRTPLAQIRMFAELQESGKLRTAEEQARATAVIHREARRLTHLVDNILRFSRLRQAMSTRFLREEIDVSGAVADLADGFAPLAASQRMTIETAVEPGLTIVANADALNQMLLNLLDNAVKYGPRGQCIHISAVRSDDDAVFCVEDEGPGVPLRDRPRIWDPYFRLSRDRESTAPGTGIGLAVVAQLVAMHGGSVSVEDGDKGARFTLRLPAVRPGSRSWPRPAIRAEQVNA